MSSVTERNTSGVKKASSFIEGDVVGIVFSVSTWARHLGKSTRTQRDPGREYADEEKLRAQAADAGAYCDRGRRNGSKNSGTGVREGVERGGARNVEGEAEGTGMLFRAAVYARATRSAISLDLLGLAHLGRAHVSAPESMI